MADLKIKLPRSKIKLTLKRPAVAADSISSYEDSGAEDDDLPVDKRDLEDATYRPNKGNGTNKRLVKKGTKPNASGLGKLVNGPSPTNKASALCMTTVSGNVYLPRLPDQPQPAPRNMKGEDGRPLKLPDNYQHLQDLTEQELLLLDKFSRTKRVVLKVSSGPGNAMALARSRQEIERRQRDSNVDHKRNIVKRPRVMGFQPDGDKKLHQNQHQRAFSNTFKGPHSPGAPPPPVPSHLGERVVKPKAVSSIMDERGMLLQSEWYSRDYKDPLVLELPKLSFEDPGRDKFKIGNTVIIWATWPKTEPDSRFCINISPTPLYDEKDPSTVVLYHFNPRDAWNKRQILQNSFSGTEWGKPDKSIVGMPIVHGNLFELKICVLPTKFVIYLDGNYLSTFPNRCDARFLKPDENLFLIVPVVETHFGDREDVRIHKVWWGYQKHQPQTSTTPKISTVPGAVPPPPANIVPGAAPPVIAGSHPPSISVNPSGNQSWNRFGASGGAGLASSGGGGRYHSTIRAPRYEEKQLFVSGLPNDLRQAYSEMLRLFEPYGITKQHGEPLIKVIEGNGYGFVTLESASSCEEAIKYLNGRPGQAGTALQVSKAKKKDRGPRSH